jgi:5-methylthioadenosine/S-adenosylhomocysteine deaminase
MKNDYLLSDATIITMNPDRKIIKNGVMVIKGDRIVWIGTAGEKDSDFKDVQTRINLKGRYIFPGLINTHVHSFQTLLKGLETDRDLSVWLKKVIAPSVATINEDDAYSAAVLSGLDGINSGTTTMVDYQYAQYKYALNPAAIKGYRDLGLRLVYARGIADTGVQFGANPRELETLEAIRRDVTRLIQEFHRSDEGLVQIAIAPSAVWMCTPSLLEWLADFSAEHNILITSHIGETEYDNQCSLEIHGMGDFQACKKYGLINHRMLMVHCIQLTEHEIESAADSGSSFSYNPVSNMYLASGCAPVKLMKKYGVAGSFGTDGAASNNNNDILETIKFGVLQAKSHFRDPMVFTAMDALEYATIDGARSLGMEDEIGSLEQGKKADFFIFNPMCSARSVPCHDPVAGLVYASDTRNIESVFINGKPVKYNNKIIDFDEIPFLESVSLTAKNLTLRMNQPQI